MNDKAVACLMFGIYEKNATGVVDRRECSVCKGDHCPYELGEPQHGACPQCFGTERGRFSREMRLNLPERSALAGNSARRSR